MCAVEINKELVETFHGIKSVTGGTSEDYEKALAELTLGIKELDQEAINSIQKRLDNLTKPQGSLGALEDIAKKLGGIQRTSTPKINKKAVLVMAGDHGVVEEGVSAAPQEVTPQMFYNFLSGGAGINVLSRHAGAEVICTDVGVASPLDPPELMKYRIRNGTDNIAKGPAMTRKEALQSIITGAYIARQAINSGYNVLATGEVGIGNTTPSAAIVSFYTGLSADKVAGRGTGLSDKGYQNKIDVIARSIEVNKPDPNDAIDVLTKIGGLEIGALAGAILEAAYSRVPIILDGIIATAAALIATRIAPLAKEYLIPSHNSAEIGHVAALEQLGLKPYLNLDFRLGEGTGAAVCFHLVEASLHILYEMATFESAGVTENIQIN